MKSNKVSNRTYTGSFGQVQVIDDFLPPPSELVFKQEPDRIKVTLTLEKPSVDFFKAQAKKHGSSYQRMIRNLISEYVQRANTL